MTRQDEFFKAVANRKIVRVRIAGIVIANNRLLVQKPTDDPSSCYALIGGEYEMGDTFESRIRKEFEEETNAKVKQTQYLFVVENRFQINGQTIQGIEHYLQVELDRTDITTKESRLLQHWIPINEVSKIDLRPHMVRDIIASGKYRKARHLIVPLNE